MTGLLATTHLLGQGSDSISISILLPMILIGLLALMVTVTGIILVSVRQMAASRKMLHAERLKAIEAGLPWNDPDVEAGKQQQGAAAFWTAFWIVVCGCGVSFIAASSFAGEASDKNVAIVAWLCAAIASVTAAISATILIVKSKTPPAPRE